MTEPSLQERVKTIAHELVVALVNLRMHAPHSDRVMDGVRRMVACFAAVEPVLGDEGVRVEIDGDELHWNGAPLIGPSLQARRLLELCALRGVRAIVFGTRLVEHEVLAFLQMLSDETAGDAFRPGVVERALRSRGIRHLRIESVAGDTDRPKPAEHGEALQQYQAMADFLQSSHVLAYRGDELVMENAAGLVERAVSQLDQEPSGLLALAMCDDIDSFTVGHSVRVTLLALQVADAAGATRKELLQVGTAALLHDIGKSRIPQEILFKAGRLDADERRLMAEHARLGGEILLEQDGVDPTAIGAAFCHHMGPGGAGYPVPVLPFEPSGVSRLVRVCDVFEALTSARPYKPAMPPLQAFAIMRRMTGAFDPRWLRFFIRSIGVYPVGSRVILDSGEEALVVAAGSNLRQPLVRLLSTADGAEASEGGIITIGTEHDGVVRRIRTVTGGGIELDVPSEPIDDGDHGASCACTLHGSGTTRD